MKVQSKYNKLKLVLSVTKNSSFQRVSLELLVLFVGGGLWKFANNGGVTHLNPLGHGQFTNLISSFLFNI